jgi:hypothetical protein
VLPLGCSENEGIGKLVGAGELTPAHRGEVESAGGEELKGAVGMGVVAGKLIEKDDDRSRVVLRGEV